MNNYAREPLSTTQNGSRTSGPAQPGPGRREVGYSPRDPAPLGAGQERPPRACPDQTPGDPRLRRFECLLTEHEAEAEYQGFLAEVEAEHLSRLEEEAAGPLFAFLARYAGEGVAA